MKEIEVEMRLRNNRLKQLRRAKGLSQKALAAEAGTHYNYVNKLENLKVSPMTKRGTWSRAALRIAEYYKVSPWYLFPEALHRLPENKATRQADIADLDLLPQEDLDLLPSSTPSPEDFVVAQDRNKVLQEALERLTERERFVIEHSFALNGVQEMTTKEMSCCLPSSNHPNTTSCVCPNYVNTIKQKGLRKMRAFFRVFRRTKPTYTKAFYQYYEPVCLTRSNDFLGFLDDQPVTFDE